MKAVHSDSKAVADSTLNHIFRGYLKSEYVTMISNNGDNPLVTPVTGDDDKPLYWTLADSTDYFWANDLIYDQSVYSGHDDACNPSDPGCQSAFEANTYNPASPCELDYGRGNSCDRY